MNYYHVTPLSYLGKENDVLTYSSDKEYFAGQVVLIPLRNKNIPGIIIKPCKNPDFATKDIIKEIYEEPILSAELLKLAIWISKYYSSALVTTLQAMVPTGITKKRRSIETNQLISSPNTKPVLKDDQKIVYKNIKENLLQKPHLLFGVTGSGKTEIYMKIAKEVLDEGKQVIILVPEISLTPQTLSRFKERFGNQVTLLHSRLKETERFANWKSILEGKKNIVIGSRSAIFAPFKNLGLIVIDEEHDPSYKQDNNPKYNTLEIAKKRCEFEGSGLILGSATPKIESYFKAKNGEYLLHTLNKRIVQTNLPEVEIVDMRNEYKYGNTSIFSESLKDHIENTLKDKMQILLFINRRGMSTFVSCRDCGYVETCPKCEVSLTFHYNTMNLWCHHCGYKKEAPIICPTCKSHAIKYFGTGTQKVEEEIKKLFGQKVRVKRMDADSTKIRGSHEEIFENFIDKKIDILIGTQMITKGWDLENIGLVGIVSADTSINFPDFTANERTFDLLTQVAGRTGRGDHPGKVIIQTYNPDHFAIRAAKNHDYVTFYNEEILNRQELSYPPFAKLIKLLYNNSDQNIGKTEAQNAVSKIKELSKKEKIHFSFLGPSPAFIPKINNKYYYQITLKIYDNNEKEITKASTLLYKNLNEDWSVDVDPSNLL